MRFHYALKNKHLIPDPVQQDRDCSDIDLSVKEVNKDGMG